MSRSIRIRLAISLAFVAYNGAAAFSTTNQPSIAFDRHAKKTRLAWRDHQQHTKTSTTLDAFWIRSGNHESHLEPVRPLRIVPMFRLFCQRLRAMLSKTKKNLTIMLATALVIFGSWSFALQPSNASTAPTQPKTPVLERIAESTSPSLDTMIDQYVQQHMFDDDRYDPIESLYRETYDDATTGKYPQALREINAAALDKAQVAKADLSLSDQNVFGGAFMKLLAAMQERGLSERNSLLIVVGLIVGSVPVIALSSLSMASIISKRNVARVMKRRYGDDFSVDATLKTEEVVEAPPDDDEEDDEPDDDDKNDSNDDGKGKSNKNKK